MPILDRNEVARSLTGAFEVFLDRPDAMRHFDVSLDGFWRSFAAIVLVAPFYALSALAERQIMLADPEIAAIFDDSLYVIDRALALGLDWVGLPIVLALVAGRIGIARTYPSFIVVRNWGAALSIVPFGAIGFLFALGFIGAETAEILSLATLLVVLRFNYLIARRALEAPVGLAIGVVVFDFALSVLIAGTVDLLLGLGVTLA